jgi:hypothetical protein
MLRPAAEELANLLAGGPALADQMLAEFDREYQAVLNFAQVPALA